MFMNIFNQSLPTPQKLPTPQIHTSLKSQTKDVDYQTPDTWPCLDLDTLAEQNTTHEAYLLINSVPSAYQMHTVTRRLLYTEQEIEIPTNTPDTYKHLFQVILSDIACVGELFLFNNELRSYRIQRTYVAVHGIVEYTYILDVWYLEQDTSKKPEQVQFSTPEPVQEPKHEPVCTKKQQTSTATTKSTQQAQRRDAIRKLLGSRHG